MIVNRRILLAHNKYKQQGGEDIVFEQESELLAANSYHVYKYVKDNSNELNSFWSQLSLIVNTYYSTKSYKEIRQRISEYVPDLVHVHNFFPLITPAIFYAAKDCNLPTVLTLHNYRLFHPNGLFLNNGRIDERGLNTSAYFSVKDKVYRGSYLQTAVVAHMIEYHKRKGTWKNKIDRFITLTDFAKSKFVEGGVPEKKIRVKPNFIEDPAPSNEQDLHKKDKHFIFIGRISKEKGINHIIDVWQQYNISTKVYIFGDGPLFESLRRKTKDTNNIMWMGHCSREEVFHYLKKAKAMLFPSVWYEGFPMTIVEALAMGTPVISSDIGSQAEIIEHGNTGLKFEPSNLEEFHQRVEEIKGNPQLTKELSLNARQEYLNKYTPEKNIERLKEVYAELI